MSNRFLTDISVSGAFKDSSDDSGSSGQILTSTGTGTEWVTPSTRDTVYSPKVYNLINSPSITTQGHKLIPDFGTLEINGTTTMRQAPSSNTDFIVGDGGEGIYEVSYSVFFNSTSTLREAIGVYLTINGAPVSGSLMANYLRANVAGGGNWSSCSNSFYMSVSEPDAAIALCVRRTDASSPPQALSMQSPVGLTIKSAVSFRRIE